MVAGPQPVLHVEVVVGAHGDAVGEDGQVLRRELEGGVAHRVVAGGGGAGGGGAGGAGGEPPRRGGWGWGSRRSSIAASTTGRVMARGHNTTARGEGGSGYLLRS